MKESIPDQQKDFEFIGRFHDFELTEAELKIFEERMENDLVFQERFHLYRTMDQHIDQALTGADQDGKAGGFKRYLQDEASRSEGLIKPIFPWRLVGMAATITLLVMAGFWWFSRAEVIDSSLALADHYWETTEKSHLFDAAQRGTGEQDRNEAARSFFRSIRSYQEKGQYPTMIDQLEIYLSTTPAPIPFEDDADWLLAISYLANDDLENARIQLRKIVDTYPARRGKAQQALADIQRLEEEGIVKK